MLNKVNELLIICQRLEENEFVGSLANLTELLYKWQDCRDKLSLSSNRSEIDRAESALYLLATYYARGEQSDFLAQLEAFKSAIRHIAKAQEFSVDNIF